MTPPPTIPAGFQNCDGERTPRRPFAVQRFSLTYGDFDGFFRFDPRGDVAYWQILL